MTVELLNEHHLDFLSLTGGCIGSSESTHASADPEGGHGKSQVIWVSIGNEQLDPPGKNWNNKI